MFVTILCCDSNDQQYCALMYITTDVIMDILGNKSMRKMVTNYYEDTGEQKLVSKAIGKAWVRERGFSDNSIDFAGVTNTTGIRKLDTLR